LQETKHDCPRISIKCGIIISVSISNPWINLESRWWIRKWS
jgi:hypothetical protein